MTTERVPGLEVVPEEERVRSGSSLRRAPLHASYSRRSWSSGNCQIVRLPWVFYRFVFCAVGAGLGVAGAEDFACIGGRGAGISIAGVGGSANAFTPDGSTMAHLSFGMVILLARRGGARL